MILATMTFFDMGSCLVAGFFLGALFAARDARRDLKVMLEIGVKQERLRARVFIKSRIDEIRRLIGCRSALVAEAKADELLALEAEFLHGVHDHRDHGRSSGGDGPDDPDCPCRESHSRAECALQGCGFCACKLSARP